PDTWVSDRAPPRHSEETDQWVAAFAGLFVTAAMAPRRPSVSTPLITVLVDAFIVFFFEFMDLIWFELGRRLPIRQPPRPRFFSRCPRPLSRRLWMTRPFSARRCRNL